MGILMEYLVLTFVDHIRHSWIYSSVQKLLFVDFLCFHCYY